MSRGPWSPESIERSESANWTDRGCVVHPRCCECPLVRCIFDLSFEERTRLLETLRTQGVAAAKAMPQQLAML